MTPTDHAAAVAVMRHGRVVLLDFDGPVCSIFSGLPARTVATEVAALLAEDGVTVPAAVVDQGDPLDVLRYAGSIDRTTAANVETALRGAELRAADTAEPTPGAAAFLTACRTTRRAVAVVSNNSGPAIAHYLDHAGLAPLVAHIEARDPTDPTLMKPHPALLNRALHTLRARPESTVIVGDSTTDVQAGRAAGVWVLGYANKPGKDRALRDAGADAVVTRMSELAELTERTPL